MPFLRIEMDRGRGWELRGEGEIADVGADLAVLRKQLDTYAVQYAHRALVDGVVVLVLDPKRSNRRS